MVGVGTINLYHSYDSWVVRSRSMVVNQLVNGFMVVDDGWYWWSKLIHPSIQNEQWWLEPCVTIMIMILMMAEYGWQWWLVGEKCLTRHDSVFLCQVPTHVKHKAWDSTNAGWLIIDCQGWPWARFEFPLVFQLIYGELMVNLWLVVVNLWFIGELMAKWAWTLPVSPRLNKWPSRNGWVIVGPYIPRSCWFISSRMIDVLNGQYMLVITTEWPWKLNSAWRSPWLLVFIR